MKELVAIGRGRDVRNGRGGLVDLVADDPGTHERRSCSALVVRVLPLGRALAPYAPGAEYEKPPAEIVRKGIEAALLLVLRRLRAFPAQGVLNEHVDLLHEFFAQV